MYVILDSNIWISELGLRSAKGAAFRFFLRQIGATLVLPEVVKLETERHVKAALTGYVAELERNYRQLLAVFGHLKELVLPDADAITAQAAGIFADCKVELLEIPFSLASARSSFHRTVDKRPPSDKGQQFKDGVIWADCLTLLETGDVVLVTADSAFFKDRPPRSEGLAVELASETDSKPHRLRIFANLTDVLDDIKTPVPLDDLTIASEFWNSAQASILGTLERQGFAASGYPRVDASFFVTEDPNRLFADFRITYSCDDVIDQGRMEAVLSLHGDCAYLVAEKRFEGFRNYGEQLAFKTPDGEEKRVRNVNLFADGLVLGHRTVDHTVRYPLNG